MPNVRKVLDAIAAGINHAETEIRKLGDRWSAREQIIAQFSAARTARMLTLNKCPSCNSDNVEEKTVVHEFPYGEEAIPLLVVEPEGRCQDCGFIWLDERSEAAREAVVTYHLTKSEGGLTTSGVDLDTGKSIPTLNETVSLLSKELDFLRFYKKEVYVCLGPADGEIERLIKKQWLDKGKTLPPGYEIEEG